jgi:DNA-binding IclR family transcriptional regulator
VQVISRAAAIMRTLESHPEGLSLAAIAERLGLARSTIQRIVTTLEAEDLLIAASPNARVRLGPGLLRLAAAVETSTAKVAKPLMLELARELGETIDLSIMARDHAVFIERVLGTHSVYAITAIATHYPLHCTANGKAMLAELGDAEIAQRIGETFERRTAHSLTTYKDLMSALKTVRRAGVAFSYEENAPGICGVGVALRDSDNNLLSLSVPVPTSRFAEQKRKIAQRLLEAKETLQRQLRGQSG